MPGSPQDGGGEGRGASGLPFDLSSKEGWTLHWIHQQGRVQEESRGHLRAGKAVASGQLVGGTQVPHGSSGPGVNPWLVSCLQCLACRH